jgi:histidine triad (HIT) family protein
MTTVSDCIFCAIIRGDIPAPKIYENDHLIVIKDIAPKAPVHLLIIPKIHVSDIASLQPDQATYASAVLLVTAELQKQLTGSQSFRLITNTGVDAGQSVFHLHFHFLSGKQMVEV